MNAMCPYGRAVSMGALSCYVCNLPCRLNKSPKYQREFEVNRYFADHPEIKAERTMQCAKDECPVFPGHKARCIGCGVTEHCPHRDPSLPRVFPQVRPKNANFAQFNDDEMKQEQVVHVCLGDDRHFYFGSIAAIFDRFTPDELGVSMAALWNYGIAPDRPYINNKCRIYRGTIQRKHQAK